MKITQHANRLLLKKGTYDLKFLFQSITCRGPSNELSQCMLMSIHVQNIRYRVKNNLFFKFK